MKIIFHIFFIIFLTMSTQVGGIIYLTSILITRITKVKKQQFRFLIFAFLYLITTYLIIPQLAPLFGRVKIVNNKYVQNHFLITTLCNRNYVKPKLNESLQIIGKELQKKHPNIQLKYLDANFPFVDNFPLLPHLSHSDGKKIDLCFIYNDDGKISNKKPSTSGYGVFEHPKKTEHHQTKICKQQGFWQYDFPKYLTFGSFNKDLEFSEKANQYLIQLILKQQTTQKIFIEPHLKKRMQLNYKKIRFHGCRAVRHDDHIHFQIK